MARVADLRVVSGGSCYIVFSVEAMERRIFYLKSRVAWLAYRSRDSRVARAASDLLVRLTELLERLEEGASPIEVLPRLSVLEADVESLLRDPGSYARNHS